VAADRMVTYADINSQIEGDIAKFEFRRFWCVLPAVRRLFSSDPATPLRWN
jgi:hypothetical protein